MSESFLSEESLIVSRTYQWLLLCTTWLAWDIGGAPCHVLLVSVCKARGGSSSG